MPDETDAPLTETPTKKPKKEKRKRSKLRLFLYTLLILILILALTVAGFAWYLKHIADSDIKHEDMLPGTTSSSSSGAQNILLLGSDSRDINLRDGSRSDVIQLVHLNADHTKISVVHFPRDLYVAIPGRGKNKINAAYAYGGPKLLVSTLQNLTGVHIDHVAQIGFDGFAKVTDDMGGVDLYVSQSFNEKGYGTWTQGWHHMNGLQARMYMQERHQLKLGDIDRGKDQQEWMAAMFKKAGTQGVLTNPFTLVKILKDTANNLAVDKGFTTGYLTSTAYSLRNVRTNDITYYTAPYTGFGMDKVAGSIDLVNEPAMKVLGQGLANDNMSAVPNGKVGSPVQ